MTDSKAQADSDTVTMTRSSAKRALSDSLSAAAALLRVVAFRVKLETSEPSRGNAKADQRKPRDHTGYGSIELIVILILILITDVTVWLVILIVLIHIGIYRFGLLRSGFGELETSESRLGHLGCA